jgi:hypothetical protein
MFGNPTTGHDDKTSEWLEKCTRAEEIAQHVRGLAEDPKEIVTGAMFVDSGDDMVSRDTILHERRAVEQAKWAAANAPKFVSHSHRLRAADNQVVGAVAVEVTREGLLDLRRYTASAWALTLPAWRSMCDTPVAKALLASSWS